MKSLFCQAQMGPVVGDQRVFNRKIDGKLHYSLCADCLTLAHYIYIYIGPHGLG